MILKTLAFTLVRPGLVVVLIPYLLLSARGVGAAGVALFVGKGLGRLIRLKRTRISAVLVLAILGEAAYFRSLPLLLSSLLITDNLVRCQLWSRPVVASRERPRSLLASSGTAAAILAAVPWFLLRAEPLALHLGSWRLFGLVPIALGACAYAWCALDFSVVGKGTPAPSQAPEVFVAVGLYRLSRNPMYVAIVSILLGESLVFRSVTLFLYALIMLQRFHFAVVLREEPTLRARFGTVYEEYLQSVSRWLPGVDGPNRLPTLGMGLRAPDKRQPDEDPTREQRVRQATDEIVQLIPPGEPFILVDQDEWGTQEQFAGRRRIPFLEREGRYWGPPADDDQAIRELERLRQVGASFMVFGWPAFWWLEHYAGLSRYLRSQFRCSLENERLVVFNLRT